MFAKLFEENGKQILVKIDANEENIPEIRFYCQPEGLGVCSVALSMERDDDESWDKAEASFDKIDKAEALDVLKKMFPPEIKF